MYVDVGLSLLDMFLRCSQGCLLTFIISALYIPLMIPVVRDGRSGYTRRTRFSRFSRHLIPCSKTTLSQPDDTVRIIRPSRHSAHCQHDQRRYYARSAASERQPNRYASTACTFQKGQLTTKADGRRACMAQ